MVEGKNVMTDSARIFVDDSRAFLRADYLPKIERCLEDLTDEDVWWRPNEESNSIGNLLLHLEGSTRGWIINTAGGAENPRNRQQEFDEREHISASELQFGSLSWKSSKTRRCRPSDSCQRVARSQRSSEPSRYAQPAHL